jgi:hypothetical protein
MGLFGGGNSSESTSTSTTDVEAGNNKQVGVDGQSIGIGATSKNPTIGTDESIVFGFGAKNNTQTEENSVGFGFGSKSNLAIKDQGVGFGTGSKNNVNAKDQAIVLGDRSSFSLTTVNSFDQNELRVFEAFADRAGGIAGSAIESAKVAQESALEFVDKTLAIFSDQTEKSKFDKLMPLLWIGATLFGLKFLMKGSKA